MAAYDALQPIFKKMLQDAPLSFSALELHTVIQKYRDHGHPDWSIRDIVQRRINELAGRL